MTRAIRQIPVLLVAAIAPLSGCGGSSTETVTHTVSAPSTTATTPSVPTSKSTPSAPSRVSCGSVAGRFVTRIQAIGANCAKARAVATAWVAQVQKGTDPSKPIDVQGYQCAARFRGPVAAVLCEQGGDPSRPRIAFAAQP